MTKLRSTVTNKIYSIKQFVNCNSIGIIYLIICSKCNKKYVGCTTRSLKERIREHINHINNTKCSNKTNTRHFMECNNSNLKYFSVQGIEHVKTGIRGGDIVPRLRKREVYWIFYLQTRLPLGFNFTFDVTSFV
ncbi:hypothetical protein XELAEV_18018898mg [Xenopus laevis]|uniref:GIY-YIG domain-containing protein n=1 Tax=Xenopus laevis TaxID=8355 RepID=A0A974HUD9_XENLA|nr:hypothetical protein XELAEV_18018898mg [Xenopus laevis]